MQASGSELATCLCFQRALGVANAIPCVCVCVWLVAVCGLECEPQPNAAEGISEIWCIDYPPFSLVRHDVQGALSVLSYRLVCYIIYEARATKWMLPRDEAVSRFHINVIRLPLIVTDQREISGMTVAHCLCLSRVCIGCSGGTKTHHLSPSHKHTHTPSFRFILHQFSCEYPARSLSLSLCLSVEASVSVATNRTALHWKGYWSECRFAFVWRS